MLTADHIALLQRPFNAAEHDFVKGSVYLRKSAIRRRLNEVDPNWTNTPPELVSWSENVITLRGGLVVCEIVRYALGTGIVNATRRDYKTQQVTELTGFELSREIAKAYKSADSDLLPRCAIHFGLGAYLKDLPRDENGKIKITNPTALAAWLPTLPTLPNGQRSAIQSPFSRG